MTSWNTRFGRAAEQQNRDAQKYAALLKSSNRLEDFRGSYNTKKIYQFLIQRASAKQSLIITLRNSYQLSVIVVSG